MVTGLITLPISITLGEQLKLTTIVERVSQEELNQDNCGPAAEEN